MKKIKVARLSFSVSGSDSESYNSLEIEAITDGRKVVEVRNNSYKYWKGDRGYGINPYTIDNKREIKMKEAFEALRDGRDVEFELIDYMPDWAKRAFLKKYDRFVYMPEYGGSRAYKIIPLTFEEKVKKALFYDVPEKFARAFASARVQWKWEFVYYFGNYHEKSYKKRAEELGLRKDIDNIFGKILTFEPVYTGIKNIDFIEKTFTKKIDYYKVVMQLEKETAIKKFKDDFDFTYPRAESFYKIVNLLLKAYKR